MAENVKRPIRIQRKRTKGWRMPDNAVYVGRPTKWGNPFGLADTFRWWLLTPRPRGDVERDAILDDIERLRGRNLACWCPLDRPCHADVLLELANQ